MRFALRTLVVVGLLAAVLVAPAQAEPERWVEATQPTQGLVWGYDTTPPDPTWSRPPLREKRFDPVYGTQVRRRSDATGTRFNRNTYSRRQAESSRGKLFLTYHGDAEYHVTRLNGKHVATLDIHPDAEPQWHPVAQRFLRYLDGPNASTGSLKLNQVNVVKDTKVVLADLTSRAQAVWPDATYMKDRAEGSPSADGFRHAWIVYNSAEQPLGIISYDLKTNTVLGTRNLRTNVGALDWVSMSPTGEYVVAGYGRGTYVYDADLRNERRINQKADHSDIALNNQGRDTYVYIDFSSGPNAGWLVATDLDDLDETRIFDIYAGGNTSIHISGKGYDKPGWVVASTYNCKDDTNWTCNKIFAVELEPNGRILNLAHTYNCGDSYWTEPHAVVNRTFTKVWFNSDGGSCGIDAEVYQLRLPDFD